MAKSLADCKNPEEAHKVIDERVKAALQQPTGEKIERFRQMIATRGGQVGQPFPPERPQQPRTQLPSVRANL